MKVSRNLLLAALVMGTMPVIADVQVNVNGTLYDVSTITTSFDANAALLEAQADWGNGDVAYDLAKAVGIQLGTPNASGSFGPFFAYNNMSGGGTEVTTFSPYLSDTLYGDEPDFADLTYALVTPAAVPEAPSALTNLALGLPFLGLTFQRFHKKRRKSASL